MLFAFVGCGKRTDWSGQGCGPFDRRDCQSDRPAEVDGLARALAQQAAERALFAASRRRSLSIAQAAWSADRKRSSLTDLRCRPARRRVDPGANFRLAQGRKRTSPAGRGLRDDLRLHLQGSATGRAVMALPHAPSQTPPPAPIETFARYHQGSRLHPRTAQACRGQNRGRPLGG